MINSILSLLDCKRKFSSKKYWNQRYKDGGNSGLGSQKSLAIYKADIINDFVSENNIKEVIEFGCGDGQQLELFKFENYIGFDVSLEAVEICRGKYKNHSNRAFEEVKNYGQEKSKLTLSLDVIYHLIEEEVYHNYMIMLFNASFKYVIIYSSNFMSSKNDIASKHVKHRRFTDWIDQNKSDFKLTQKIENKYPYNPKENSGSFADFYIYEKF